MRIEKLTESTKKNLLEDLLKEVPTATENTKPVSSRSSTM